MLCPQHSINGLYIYIYTHLFIDNLGKLTTKYTITIKVTFNVFFICHFYSKLLSWFSFFCEELGWFSLYFHESAPIVTSSFKNYQWRSNSPSLDKLIEEVAWAWKMFQWNQLDCWLGWKGSFVLCRFQLRYKV